MNEAWELQENSMSTLADYNRQLITEFRARGGNVDGRPLLLLTTTGAKSGQSHTAPLMSIPDGKRFLVLASNAGAEKAPDWYHNLVVNPQVTVEVGGATFETKAVVADGEEREHLWAKVIAIASFFVEHQAKISRQIPIVILDRPPN
jgi:deazaflavin-dependent oxidoreductase (nitroreductase family)